LLYRILTNEGYKYRAPLHYLSRNNERASKEGKREAVDHRREVN